MRTQTAINEFLEAKYDRSKRYLDQCEQCLAELRLSVPELPGEVRVIRRILKQASTPWTKLYHWNIYNIFYHWCHREYDLKNIMEKVDKPQVPEVEIRALSRLELALVMASAYSLLAKAICSLALDCGVRASEFGHIRIQDISPETILLHGKRNRILRVPLNPETYLILRDLAQSIPERPGSLVFADGQGRPLSRFAIYRIVRQSIDRAGITGPKRGPHCLRHSLGMNYIANGGDPFSLKRIMRHKNIATTQKYVNLSLEKVCEFHHRYSPLRGALQGAQGVLIKPDILAEAEALVRKETSGNVN